VPEEFVGLIQKRHGVFPVLSSVQIKGMQSNVRFWHIADIPLQRSNVRF
jgi:hypothetical protein